MISTSRIALAFAIGIGSQILVGCADPSMIQLGYQAISEAGTVAVSQPLSSDSTLSSVTLPRRISATDFTNGVREIAKSDHFDVSQVQRMPTVTGTVAMITLTKSKISYIPFDKGWSVSVNLSLHADGVTVDVTPRVRGKGPSVEEITASLKSGLLKKFT